eukprot:jgi/Chrzof1/890/Cz01g32250.t1
MSSKASLEALKLTELKEECKRLGLPVTGKKEQLVTRILEAQSHQEEEEVGESVPEAAGANATAAAPTVGNADSTADDGLAAAVDPAVTHAAGLSSGKHGKIVFAVHDDGSVEHKPPAATDRQGSMSKLIALEKASSGDAAKPNPAPTAANIDKVKQLTVEERNKLREAKFQKGVILDPERLKARAQRFNLPCKEIEDEKKLARKKRFNTLTAADKQQEEQKARQELVGDEEAKRKRIEKFGKPLMLPGGSSSDPDKLKQRAARFGKALAPAGGAAVSNTDDDARKKARLERFGNK